MKKDYTFSHMKPDVIKGRIKKLNSILKLLLSSSEANQSRCRDFLLPDDAGKAPVAAKSPRGNPRGRKQSIFASLMPGLAPKEDDGWVVLPASPKGGRAVLPGSVPTEIAISVVVALVSCVPPSPPPPGAKRTKARAKAERGRRGGRRKRAALRGPPVHPFARDPQSSLTHPLIPYPRAGTCARCRQRTRS